MIFLSHLGGKCQQIECIIDTTHSIAALPFAFVQASATLLAFRFFPRAPWTLLTSKFFVPSCNHRRHHRRHIITYVERTFALGASLAGFSIRSTV